MTLCDHVFYGKASFALSSNLIRMPGCSFVQTQSEKDSGAMPRSESIAWKASVHQLQCVAVDMTMAPPPSSSFEPWLRWLIRLTNVANEHSFGTGGVHWCTYNLKILKLLQGKPRSKISKRESTCGPHSDVQIGPCSLHSSEWFRGEQTFLHHLITCVQLADLSSGCLWAFCCLSACQGRKKPMRL